MEIHLKALLELIFYTKPPNFGVEALMEARTGVALTSSRFELQYFGGAIEQSFSWLVTF
jgi:hypothetical protein